MKMNQTGLSLFHRVKPPVEEAEGRPPLLLLLHGYGSNEEDLFGLAPYLDKRFLIISARAPLTLEYGMYAWCNLIVTENEISAVPEEAEAGLALLSKFTRELADAYDFDPRRVFLMGFSQGAMMGLSLALTEPERVAGVVVMSGRLPLEVEPHIAAPERLEGLPIFVAHGIYDAMISIADARATWAALEKLPVALTYHEYAMAHEVNFQSLSDISAWLTARLDEKRDGKDAEQPDGEA